MKKIVLGIILVVIFAIVIFVLISPRQPISFSSGFGGFGPYINKCLGIYIQTYNETPVDGPRGGYCYGKVIQIENKNYNPIF